MFKCIGGFKFGGMVWYYHMYMYTVENLEDFNLAVERHTAKFSGYMVVWTHTFWITPYNHVCNYSMYCRHAH